MRKRGLIQTFAALGVALTQASPALAGPSDRVSFQISPKVVSEVLERVDGETRLLVVSNSAFGIHASGLIGKVKVTIEETGSVGGKNFGSASQLPGQRTTETFLSSVLESPIYRGDRKTAQNPGSPIDQAVLVRITYSGTVHPRLTIKPIL